MSPLLHYVLSLLCIAGMVWGIRWMNSPKTAVRGNLLGSVCVLCGILLTLEFAGLFADWTLWIGMAAGGLAGWLLAVTTALLRIPQLVGLLNGLGGAASALTAIVVLRMQPESLPWAERVTAVLATAVGTVTFSGSMVAAAKLDRKLPQRPLVLPAHSHLTTVFFAGLVLLIVLTAVSGIRQISDSPIPVAIVGLALGGLAAIRVGGADMPITISLFNSLSGVAGALTGFAVGEPILVAAGGIVGTAGLILTTIMCKAANRSLLPILLGQTCVAEQPVTPESLAAQDQPGPQGAGGEQTPGAATAPSVEEEPGAGDVPAQPGAPDEEAPSEERTASLQRARITDILRGARSVAIVPGYGMALAGAQGEVKRLIDLLEQMGTEVWCAIHPLAGRMPGHMHVLLAEVEVPYEKLLDMDKINDRFRDLDAVVVVGANDVVNPAASTAVKTPIYGMPILRVSEARWVIICNQDTQPGYSGVPNPLYDAGNAVLYLGDAAATLHEIVEALEEEPPGGTTPQ